MVKQDQQTVFRARERRVQGLTFFSLLAHVKIEYAKLSENKQKNIFRSEIVEFGLVLRSCTIRYLAMLLWVTLATLNVYCTILFVLSLQ